MVCPPEDGLKHFSEVLSLGGAGLHRRVQNRIVWCSYPLLNHYSVDCETSPGKKGDNFVHLKYNERETITYQAPSLLLPA